MSNVGRVGCGQVAGGVFSCVVACQCPHPSQNPQVDLATLRKLAVVRGLGSHALRARAWPLLLGARAAPDDVAELGALAAAGHADAAVVECDVERSLWSFTKGERIRERTGVCVWMGW